MNEILDSLLTIINHEDEIDTIINSCNHIQPHSCIKHETHTIKHSKSVHYSRNTYLTYL